MPFTGIPLDRLADPELITTAFKTALAVMLSCVILTSSKQCRFGCDRLSECLLYRTLDQRVWENLGPLRTNKSKSLIPRMTFIHKISTNQTRRTRDASVAMHENLSAILHYLIDRADGKAHQIWRDRLSVVNIHLANLDILQTFKCIWCAVQNMRDTILVAVLQVLGRVVGTKEDMIGDLADTKTHRG